jgi:hypothetical protein
MATNQSANSSVSEQPRGSTPSVQVDESFNSYGLHSVHIHLARFAPEDVCCEAKYLYARLAGVYRGRKEHGLCSPRLETLAKEAHTPLDTIERRLPELVDRGLRRRIGAPGCDTMRKWESPMVADSRTGSDMGAARC